MPEPVFAIETDRLVLRDFREQDWVSVHEYAVDPEVYRYMPWGPNSEEDTRSFLNRAMASRGEEPRTQFELAVTFCENGRLIGGAGIRAADADFRTGDMGYCLRRDVWGRGLATEVARALIAFGFGELGLHRIWATCDVENLASARVLEKAGMTREGLMRDDSWVRGHYRSSYLYSVLEQERKEG